MYFYREIMGRYLFHLAILLSFGLASSVLGIMIIIAIINECYITKIWIGRYIAMDKTATIKTSSHQAEHQTKTTANILILEEDMQDAWKAFAACQNLIIFIVFIFWAGLFFDMIADVYTTHLGINISAVFGLVVPVLLILFMRHLCVLPETWSTAYDDMLQHNLKIDCVSHERVSNRSNDDEEEEEDDEEGIEFATISPIFRDPTEV
jgi:hypothetical protein